MKAYHSRPHGFSLVIWHVLRVVLSFCTWNADAFFQNGYIWDCGWTAICPYAFEQKPITHFLDACLGPQSGGPCMAPDSQRACVNEAGLVVG